MDGSEAFDWFCEQYEGNEIAQGLIRQLSQDTRYISDQWSVTYGHQIRKSVDVRDLIHFKGISERATLDCTFKSLLKRTPSSEVDVDAVQEEYQRCVTLLDASDLGDRVKIRYRECLEELVCSTYCLPSQPWITSSPFVDVLNLDGDLFLLHCQTLPGCCLRMDATGRAQVTEAAKTWTWKLVEWMLHVIWASGHHNTAPVAVYIGFFGATKLISWEWKKFDPTENKVIWTAEAHLLGDQYRACVLEKLQPDVERVDLGHVCYDTGQIPGKFAIGTEVFNMHNGRTGTVIQVETRARVRLRYKDIGKRSACVQVKDLLVVAIKSDEKDELMPAPVAGRLAAVAKGHNSDLYGRVVQVDSVHQEYCFVHYIKDGEKVAQVKIRKKFLKAIDGEKPATPWHVAMFVPDEIVDDIGLNNEGNVDPTPVSSMTKKHFAPSGSTSTLVRFSYPPRAKIDQNADHSVGTL